MSATPCSCAATPDHLLILLPRCRELARLVALRMAAIQSSSGVSEASRSVPASRSPPVRRPSSSPWSSSASRSSRPQRYGRQQEPAAAQLDEVLLRVLLRGLQPQEAQRAEQESIARQTSEAHLPQVR